MAGHKKVEAVRSAWSFCGYYLIRMTSTLIFLRSRPGYFERSFSASSFDLKGFDGDTGTLSTYWKRIHFPVGFGISIFGC